MNKTLPAAARKPGTRILAKRSDGYWYPATVVLADTDTAKIAYDDGTFKEMSASELRAIDWDKDSMIECDWRGKGDYYPAHVLETITSYASDDQILVTYPQDNAQEETTIARCRANWLNQPTLKENLTANTGTLTIRLVSITLMIIGAGAIFWGYELSGSISSQITETISGSSSDEALSRYIGGTASLIAGLYLFFTK